MTIRERFAILTTKDSQKWLEILEEIGSYDSYHLPKYHELSEVAGEGIARLLVYRRNGCTMAFPVLLRAIDPDGSLGIGGSLNDATSVYGYPGPIASGDCLSNDARRGFADAIQDFFVSSNVICAFSRLNPILKDKGILAGYGETVEIGPTLSMDLTVPVDEQFMSFRRSHRSDIMRLEDMGVTCVEEGAAGRDDFLQVYYQTMDRNHSEQCFYFNRAYFDYLTSKMPECTHTFVCRDESGPVSAMIVLECNGIIHGHLGGAVNRSLRIAPIKLCYDTVCRWGHSIGAQVFHLGGGRGGQKDSLLEFKRGFSKREHVFCIWRHVVSPDLYRQACDQACRHHGKQPGESYFPVYRNPELLQSFEPTNQPREQL